MGERSRPTPPAAGSRTLATGMASSAALLILYSLASGDTAGASQDASAGPTTLNQVDTTEGSPTVAEVQPATNAPDGTTTVLGQVSVPSAPVDLSGVDFGALGAAMAANALGPEGSSAPAAARPANASPAAGAAVVPAAPSGGGTAPATSPAPAPAEPQPAPAAPEQLAPPVTITQPPAPAPTSPPATQAPPPPPTAAPPPTQPPAPPTQPPPPPATSPSG